MALWTSESCCCCAEQEYLDSASDQVLGLGQDWRQKIQITIAKPRRGEVCFCYVKDGTEVRHPGQTWGCHPWVRESSCLWISALPPHVLYTLPELQPSCLYFRQEKRKSKGKKKKKRNWPAEIVPKRPIQWLLLISHWTEPSQDPSRLQGRLENVVLLLITLLFWIKLRFSYCGRKDRLEGEKC